MFNCSVDLFGLTHCDSSPVLNPSRGTQYISVSLVNIRGEMSGVSEHLEYKESSFSNNRIEVLSMNTFSLYILCELLGCKPSVFLYRSLRVRIIVVF